MFTRRDALLGSFATAAVTAVGSRAAHAVRQDLIDAAKKEGETMWYSTEIVPQIVLPLQAGFQKKYGIRMNFISASVQETSVRLLTEARMGPVKADVVDAAACYGPLNDAGLIQPYQAEEAADFPAVLKEPSGLWTCQMIQINGPAINTTMVTPEQAPKSFEDLLNPRWKGMMAWSNSEEIDGPPGFVGNVLLTMGQDLGMAYLRRLSEQKIANVPSNFRVVLDQCIAGQYPLVLCVFNYHAAISRDQGAPVQWMALERSVMTPSPIMLLKNSPHPNAGKLFVEYMLSEEGQRVAHDAGYIPGNPKVQAKHPELKPEVGHFQVNVISMELYKQQGKGWTDIYRSLFI